MATKKTIDGSGDNPFVLVLIIFFIALITAILVPMLVHEERSYTIKTPTGVYHDTNCRPAGGGVQCTNAFYGGDSVVTEDPKK